MRRFIHSGAMLAPIILLASCAHVSVAPIEVKPIHIVHDINIRVDKQLDDFFAFQEKAAASQPATPQSVNTAAAEAAGA